jgi:hypothetical protein
MIRTRELRVVKSFMKLYYIIFFGILTLKGRAIGKSDSLIIVRNFGGTIEYGYQNANMISGGPNYCFGVVKDKSQKGTHFYSIETLYTEIIRKGNYYNGFSGGFNYNYVGNKGLGLNSGIHCLLYSKNVLLTPSIGFNCFGIIGIEYGYSFDLMGNINEQQMIPHQIKLRLFLNKTLGLIFKQV